MKNFQRLCYFSRYNLGTSFLIVNKEILCFHILTTDYHVLYAVFRTIKVLKSRIKILRTAYFEGLLWVCDLKWGSQILNCSNEWFIMIRYNISDSRTQWQFFMNTALFNSSLGIINLERVAALLANWKSAVVNRRFIYNTYIIKLVR